MKFLMRFLFIVVVTFSILSLSSCAKKSYPDFTGKHKRHTVASVDPATPKKQPLRKHYIIPKKRKRILGSDYR